MEIENRTNLFVNFKVKDQTYALSADIVESIFELKQELTPVPKSSDCVMGLIPLRGKFMPVIDLRRLIGLESLDQEEKAFIQMLHDRKQDHIRWVEQLEKSVEEDVPFTLATDHHQCAFGKWYDQYQAPSHAVRLAMGSIDAPHQAIHRSAIDCFACREDREKQRRIIRNVTTPAMNGVLRGIDQMIAEFTSGRRKMCIAISENGTRYGIAVDAILSVEQMEKVQALDVLGENELVCGYGSSKSQEHILLMDSIRIFSLLRRLPVEQSAEEA
jgi:chemotaxis signal transduction protein